MKDYFRPYTLRPVVADEKPETSDMQNIVGRVMNDASAGLPVQDMEPQTVIAFEDDHIPYGTFAAEKRRGISRSRFADRDPLSVFVLSAAADTVVGNLGLQLPDGLFQQLDLFLRPAQPFVSLGEFFFGYEHDFRFLG